MVNKITKISNALKFDVLAVAASASSMDRQTSSP
jgi:hypothetical protein